MAIEEIGRITGFVDTQANVESNAGVLAEIRFAKDTSTDKLGFTVDGGVTWIWITSGSTFSFAVSDTSTIDLTWSGGTLSGIVLPAGIKLDDLGAPDNNTDLDASVSTHGLAPKGTTGTTQFWRQDWTLATPAGGGGGGDVYGSASVTDSHMAGFDTDGYHIKDIGAVPTLSGTDGWIAESDTWVYVSATSFKITGKDVRTRFPILTKLRCKQGAGYLYFHVVGAAMSGSDTLVTITGGSDYSLANAVITDNYFSYFENPQGFPVYFNFTQSTLTGWTSPTVTYSTFTQIGPHAVLIRVRVEDSGSNSVNTVITLPFTSTGASAEQGVRAMNNGSWLTTPASVNIADAAATATVYKDFAGNTWSATGNKGLIAQFIEMV